MSLNQNKISELEQQIKKLMPEKEYVFEFACALANVKSGIENNLAATAMKISIEASMKHLTNMFGGK